MKADRAAWMWIALTMALHTGIWWRDGWRTSPVAAPAFALPGPMQRTADVAPIWWEEFIDPHPAEASAHVSSICELPSGRLAAAWYAGTREGDSDVAIYVATQDAGPTGGWSRPQRVVTRETAATETFRFVQKVGNPLLFSNGDGILNLLYVTVGFGGWSSSSLNFKQSLDGGRTWSFSRRLGLSPFFNVSELVKNGTTRLAGGGWVVPIYHEVIGKFPELLWLRSQAQDLEFSKIRAFGGKQAFQPALIPLDDHNGLLLCRTAGRDKRIQAAATSDAGLHWTDPQPIELPKPDSGLDALHLHDGRLLLAFNDSTRDRDQLRLAICIDVGLTWTRAATIALEAGAEFSYPFLLQTNDGLIHLTYTWKRRAIRHVAFNLAWLEAQAIAHPSWAGEVGP